MNNTIRIIYNPLTSSPPTSSITVSPVPSMAQAGVVLVFKSFFQFSLNFNRINSTGSIKEEKQVQIDLGALQQLVQLVLSHFSSPHKMEVFLQTIITKFNLWNSHMKWNCLLDCKIKYFVMKLIKLFASFTVQYKHRKWKKRLLKSFRINRFVILKESNLRYDH